jgi:predicted lipid-binding transport protein (Tim44 family)
MFEDKTKVLLMVPHGLLDRARGFAGEATSKLKRPVSLQMVLRALIDEGWNRNGDGAVLVNIEGQVQAVRRIRSRAGRESGKKDQRMPQSGVRRSVSRGTQ